MQVLFCSLRSSYWYHAGQVTRLKGCILALSCHFSSTWFCFEVDQLTMCTWTLAQWLSNLHFSKQCPILSKKKSADISSISAYSFRFFFYIYIFFFSSEYHSIPIRSRYMSYWCDETLTVWYVSPKWYFLWSQNCTLPLTSTVFPQLNTRQTITKHVVKDDSRECS